VPSWNNNHYCYLTGARGVPIEVTRASRFHPTASRCARCCRGAAARAQHAAQSDRHRDGARGAADISRAIVEENAARAERGERPVFLMYDQVYWRSSSRACSR
jgi:aspartate aminotransferase